MSEVDKIWSAMAPNARPSVPDCHLTNPDFNPNWPFLSPWFCPRIWPSGQAYQSQRTPCIVTFNKDFMALDVLSCCLALTDLDAKWVVNSHSGDTLVFNISFVLALLYFTLPTHGEQLWTSLLIRGSTNQIYPLRLPFDLSKECLLKRFDLKLEKRWKLKFYGDSINFTVKKMKRQRKGIEFKITWQQNP